MTDRLFDDKVIEELKFKTFEPGRDGLNPSCAKAKQPDGCYGCPLVPEHDPTTWNIQEVKIDPKRDAEKLHQLSKFRHVHWILWRLSYLTNGIVGWGDGYGWGQSTLWNAEESINFADSYDCLAYYIGERLIGLKGNFEGPDYNGPHGYQHAIYQKWTIHGDDPNSKHMTTYDGMVQAGDVVVFSPDSCAYQVMQPTIVRVVGYNYSEGNQRFDVVVELDIDPKCMHDRAAFGANLGLVPVKIFREAGARPKWHESILTTSLHYKKDPQEPKVCKWATCCFTESNVGQKLAWGNMHGAEALTTVDSGEHFEPGFAKDSKGRCWYCAKVREPEVTWTYDPDLQKYVGTQTFRSPSRIEDFAPGCALTDCDRYEPAVVYNPNEHISAIIGAMVIGVDKVLEWRSNNQAVYRRIHEPNIFELTAGVPMASGRQGFSWDDPIILYDYNTYGAQLGAKVDIQYGQLMVTKTSMDSADALQKYFSDESAAGWLEKTDPRPLWQISPNITRDYKQRIYGLDYYLKVDSLGLFSIRSGLGLASRLAGRDADIWIPSIAYGQDGENEIATWTWSGNVLTITVKHIADGGKEPRVVATRAVYDLLPSGWWPAWANSGSYTTHVVQLKHVDHMITYKNEQNQWITTTWKGGSGEGFPLPHNARLKFGGDQYAAIGFSTGGVRAGCVANIENEWFIVTGASPCCGGADDSAPCPSVATILQWSGGQGFIYRRDIFGIYAPWVSQDWLANSLPNSTVTFYNFYGFLAPNSTAYLVKRGTNNPKYTSNVSVRPPAKIVVDFSVIPAEDRPGMWCICVQ